jgi:predicted transposase/invertase (TIGR01784 family)
MDEFPSGTDLAAHPNDAFFKAIFSEPERATAFFKSHLPSAIAARIDWPSLAVIPTSFVKSNLQQVHSDLLFSVNLAGRETLLYLLFEHQSTPDPTMPLRLLGYISEIFTSHHKTHGFPLPPVIPFVFHQGPESWNISTAFEDLFDLQDDLAADLLPFLPKFDHALLDLSRFDPDTGETDAKVRVVMQLMKLARQKELLRFFRWLTRFPANDFPENLLRLMLLYALHADSDLDVETIYHTLSTNPELEKNTMSVAEKLISKGLSQGLSQGRQIGKIQLLQEFLDLPVSSNDSLATLPADERDSMQKRLFDEHERRFKRN